MDQEFDKVAEHLPLVESNTTAAREHVGEIERDIWTQKEQCRAIILVQPYTVLPKPMVIQLVYFCVLWLNTFPNKLGISRAHSLREIVTG